MSGEVYERAIGTRGQVGDKVAVTVTDTTATLAVKSPPADLFRFAPADRAREVLNVASGREKKG